MQFPKFNSYVDYSSGNYGVHALVFHLPNGAKFYFSYDTLVAFRTPAGKFVVRQNDWGTMTGKHLNAIDGGDKRSRVDHDTFEKIYQEEFGG